MRPSRRSTLLVVVVALWGLPACTATAVTSQGEDIADLYRFFFIAAVAVFVLTAGLIGWSIIRYRSRTGQKEPAQFHSNVKLELAWFAVPQILVVVLFLFSATVLGNIDREPSEDDPSGERVTVEVVGFQWGWRFNYEDAGVSVTGIPADRAVATLPVDRPITLELVARDVIHSFYVPRFLTKRDLIPGRRNSIQVTIEEEGTYQGFCAEFCGLLHSRMTFQIEAVTNSEYEAWLEEQEAADGG
jgi:cytochrome c oxidase subunit 2